MIRILFESWAVAVLLWFAYLTWPNFWRVSVLALGLLAFCVGVFALICRILPAEEDE